MINLTGDIAEAGVTIIGVVSIPTTVTNAPYTGSYTIDPSQESQTIPIRNKVATQDITVNPIPDYYGRVTWDGSVLTIT